MRKGKARPSSGVPGPGNNARGAGVRACVRAGAGAGAGSRAGAGTGGEAAALAPGCAAEDAVAHLLSSRPDAGVRVNFNLPMRYNNNSSTITRQLKL